LLQVAFLIKPEANFSNKTKTLFCFKFLIFSLRKWRKAYNATAAIRQLQMLRLSSARYLQQNPGKKAMATTTLTANH